MPTPNELKKIADLAYLDITTEQNSSLQSDVMSIMAYVNQLQQVETSTIAPLSHPLEMQQPLRTDHVSDHDRANDLEKIAPIFSERLYLVPKVIDTGK